MLIVLGNKRQSEKHLMRTENLFNLRAYLKKTKLRAHSSLRHLAAWNTAGTWEHDPRAGGFRGQTWRLVSKAGPDLWCDLSQQWGEVFMGGEPCAALAANPQVL